jgi:hypothetical protein
MTAFPLILAALIALPPAAFAQDSEPSGNSELSGRLLKEDGTPLVGATLLAYHLATTDVFTAEPTNDNGEYELTGLPYGYFDLAVETPDGLYVASEVVNISPSSKSVLTLTVGGFIGATEEARTFPGTDAEPVGVARVKEKPGGKDFWKSGKGIAIIAGGGAALLLLATSSGGDDNASPSTP